MEGKTLELSKYQKINKKSCKETNMNIENEVWKPVVGFEGYYEVSLNGVVKGIDRKVVTKAGLRAIKSKILNKRINNCGYAEVRLSKDGKKTTAFIHVLIAKAFIPNPHNKPQVNHLNGLKTDNCIDNLEWCTQSENMQHASRIGLLKRTYKQVIDNCTGRTYISSYEAAVDFNIGHTTLKNYLNGNRKNQTCLEYAK